MPPDAAILVVSERLARAELARLVGSPFQDMVKFVVDVERRIAAVGGELHSDAEALLLEHGSAQESLPRPRRGGVHRVSLLDQHPTLAGKPRDVRRGSGAARAHPYRRLRAPRPR